MPAPTNTLPWKFEAFREYVTYQTLQAAAAVLIQYEGEEFSISNPRIQEMQKQLSVRTGKDKWVPDRSGSEDINWNTEGDVYRNKGRVLTSMFIIEPKDSGEEDSGTLRLLPFGRALARGQITEQQFYDFIITRYKFPHPAYDENWLAWRSAGRRLFPFAYILQVLIALYGMGADQAYLTTDEVAQFLHPDPDHSKVLSHARAVRSARTQQQSSGRQQRSDDVHRKITDILGFLCITGYCYFRPDGSVGLNLRARHGSELAYFEGRRKGDDRLLLVENLVRDIR